MYKIVISLALIVGISLTAQDHGEPPVKAPYPTKLDRAESNQWWVVAKQARDGKLGSKRHPQNSKTVICCKYCQKTLVH